MSVENLGKVIETDVLVIGGAYSGLWAANRAKEFADDVLIIEKGPQMGLAGQAFFSGGGIQAAPPEANPEDHVRDTVCLGDGLYEQDLLKKIYKQSWDRILDYERLGVEFLKEDDGSHWYIPQRGLDHLWCYLGKPFGSGGEDMMKALTKEAKRLGVKYLSRVFVTDLLKYDGAVVGAVGFDTRSGQFYIFKAGAVIITTGQGAMKGHYEDIAMSCGTGIDMAYRAGAELKNMEFATIWVIPKHFRWEGITYMLPLGARFVDANGEPFMDKYSPILKSNIDYNYLTRFMAMEAKKGNSPFYLDCSQMTPKDKDRMTPDGGWTELQYKRLLESGIRPFEEKQEWCPGMWGIAGGLHSDLDMATNLPGLFVAGKARDVDPGVYFGGWSLCMAAGTGRFAGESAAKYAMANKEHKIDESEVSLYKKDLYSSMENGGFDSEQILYEVQKTIFPYDVLILKNEKKLKEALGKIQYIQNELVPKMGAKEIRDLMRLRETRSIAQMAELFLETSLLRTETRASHYREDYPQRDASWLKWIFVSCKDGKKDFRYVPVPVDKYGIKIDRFYMDNFKF